MSTDKETRAAKGPEPVLICHAGLEAKPRGELGQQVAEHAGRPVPIVSPPR